MSNKYPNKQKRHLANIFSDWREELPKTLEPVKGGKFPAQLFFKTSAEKDKIFLYVNDGVYNKDGDSYKAKSIRIPYLSFLSFINHLKTAATDRNFKAQTISLNEKLFRKSSNDGKDVYRTAGTLTINRDNKRRLRVIYKNGDYRVSFLMTSALYVVTKKLDDGSWAEDLETTSNMYTLSYADGLKAYFGSIIPNNHTLPTQSTTNNYRRDNNDDDDYDTDTDADDDDYDDDDDDY